MKIWSVFSLVIAFHVAVIGLLLIQPGCQSKPAVSAAPAEPAQEQAEQPEQLDPAFNAGVPATGGGRTLSAPSRPAGITRTEPQTSGLEQVLEPVREEEPIGAESSYAVVKGDTLSGIARKQGVTLDSILAANGLTKTSKIYVGQTLRIPAGAAAPAAAATTTAAAAPVASSGREVTVQKGDSLSRIASRHGTTVKALKAVNNLSSDTIRIGQKLVLPDSATAPASGSAAPATISVPQSSAPAAGGATYTVQPGDTPGAIARKFGVTAADLMAANNISDPRKMAVGKTLVIPAGGTAPVQSASAPAPVVPAMGSGTAATVAPAAQPGAAAPQDPMSALEALEDEDLPYVEVEAVPAPQAQPPAESGN